MKLRDEPLNIPLYRRSHDKVFFVIAAVILGILYVKPDTTQAWIVAIMIMTPTFWFVFVGPEFLDTWKRRSRYIIVSWFILTAKLALFILVVKYASPYLEAVLGELLHA